MMELASLLEIAVIAADKASQRILEIYNTENFDVELKGDSSPLTKADRASHEIICEELEPTDLPILSEEGKDILFKERSKWKYFWMVDPIDGTKEFIKRNGEFTVNISLIHQYESVLGVVQVPVSGDVYTGSKGGGAKKNGRRIHVSGRRMDEEGLRVVASRSHLNKETQDFIDDLRNPVIVSKGSSLKLLMVAEGEADVYPRFAPTMEWDTAAAQAIVRAAGGKVLIKDTEKDLTYNKEDLMNPRFLVTSNI